VEKSKTIADAPGRVFFNFFLYLLEIVTIVMYISYVMMKEGIDKRKFPRARYRCLIRVLDKNKLNEVEAFTENIASGGICVASGDNIGLFEKVKLEVFLGTEKGAVSCEGVVVWVVKKHSSGQSVFPKYVIGIEFSDMRGEDRRSISNLVSHIMGA